MDSSLFLENRNIDARHRVSRPQVVPVRCVRVPKTPPAVLFSSGARFQLKRIHAPADDIFPSSETGHLWPLLEFSRAASVETHRFAPVLISRSVARLLIRKPNLRLILFFFLRRNRSPPRNGVVRFEIKRKTAISVAPFQDCMNDRQSRCYRPSGFTFVSDFLWID